jgi:Ca2+-dependent lipid-binding protein
MHRQRGEKFSPPTPESVEWLNAFIKTIWGLVNPDMFVSVADMIEDIMQVRHSFDLFDLWLMIGCVAIVAWIY